MTNVYITAARLVISFTNSGFIMFFMGDTTRKEEVSPARPFSLCKESVKTAGNTTVLNVHLYNRVVSDITFILSNINKAATIAFAV